MATSTRTSPQHQPGWRRALGRLLLLRRGDSSERYRQRRGHPAGAHLTRAARLQYRETSLCRRVRCLVSPSARGTIRRWSDEPAGWHPGRRSEDLVFGGAGQGFYPPVLVISRLARCCFNRFAIGRNVARVRPPESTPLLPGLLWLLPWRKCPSSCAFRAGPRPFSRLGR